MTQPTSISSPAEGQRPPTCRHHWVIQPAAGPVSPGVCQTCGEVREFKNYVPDLPWGHYDLSPPTEPVAWNRQPDWDDYRKNDDEKE